MRKKHHTYIVLAVLLWSTAEVATRVVIESITPIQLAFVRFSIGAACMIPFLPAELRQKGLRLNRRILGIAAFSAFIGIVCANLLYQYSLKYAGASVVGTMFGITPLLTFIFAIIGIGEVFTWRKFSGVMLGIGGIVILGLSKESQTFSFVGYAFSFACCTCVALFTVLLKRFAGPYIGLPIITLCCSIGAIAFVPMVLIEAETATLYRLDGFSILAILYLAIGTTGISYLLYTKGLESVDATVASSALMLKPPIATGLAALALAEAVTPNLAAALGLVLLGLYLVARSPLPPPALEAMD